MQAIAEGVALVGERAGLERKRLLEVLVADCSGRTSPCGKLRER